MSGRLLCRTGLCLVLIVALFGFQACSHDDDPVGPDQGQAPVLPDISTMTMDLSFFDPAPVDRASIETGKPSPNTLAAATGKDNFINAAVRVFCVQLVFWAALEPPVGAFALAIHSVPRLQSDGSWLWTYIFVDGDIEYSIFLYGVDAGDRTHWRMEVSSNNPEMPLDHFLWFQGDVMKHHDSGYWQFYEPDAAPPAMPAASAAQTPGHPSIRMEWFNSPGEIHQLTVLNNNPYSEDEGDTVVLNVSPLVSYLEFTDVSVPEVYNITWYADGSGSIHVPDYNNNEKACWDTRQNDVECP